MWQLVPCQSLRHRGWEDEFVVYNDLSGDTHLLGADAMDLLRLLKGAPRQEQDLHDALFLRSAEAASDNRALRDLLLQLSAIFLIEEC